MRILILTQWYPPEPAYHIHELAQHMKKKGHCVTVLTGFPNYPSGKIYPGYRLRLLKREQLEDVPVVRVVLYPEHSPSGLKRVLNYLSFAISTTLLGILAVAKPDVIFVYHPPLTIGLPAIVLSRLWGVPFVYQVQDMWPETLKATEMLSNEKMIRFIGRSAMWVYGKAHKILVISPGFRRNLIGKGVPSEKVRVIPNWVNSSIYKNYPPSPTLAEKLNLRESFNIIYAGNIGAAQGLETVLEAASLLYDMPAVKFVFVGDGVLLPSLQKIALSRDLKNVQFIGRYAYREMPALYALADALLIHLKDDPLFRITIPSKTLAYLAAGKPIIAAVSGDVADIITSTKAGIVCQPGNPYELAESIRLLYRMTPLEREKMAAQGRKAAAEFFSSDTLIAKIEEELRQAVSNTT